MDYIIPTTMLKQDIVSHGDKTYLVSTINRTSSAQLSYVSYYAETLVWEWFPETKTRGKIIGQDEAPRDSLHSHNRICNCLLELGLLEYPDGDE